MTEKKLDEAGATNALEERARGVTRKDVDDVVGRKKEIDEKLKAVPGKLKKMVNQIGLLFEVVRANWMGEYKEIPYTSIAMAVAALIYFLSPVDLIPDFIPVIGYVDDALVVGLAIAAIQDDLKQYCQFKGYDTAKYF